MIDQTIVVGDVHKKTIDNLENKKDKDNYIEYREEFRSASNFSNIKKYPIHLDIEIDNYCNFACTFCPIGQPENELHDQYKTIKKLDKNKVLNILEEAKKIGVKSVQFSLVNEPLTNKNLFEYIEYANKLNFCDIQIVSNAYLLNEKNAEKILNSGLKKIQFSLDAFSEKTYSERRLKNNKPANYEKTIKNLLNFLDMKKKSKKIFPIVKISFIEMEENIHEKQDFYQFWNEKVDAIHYQKLIDYTETHKKNDLMKIYKCNMPMFRLAIKADGGVKPCCVSLGEKINLGNINKEKLFDIWNSKKMKDFQQMHLDEAAHKNEHCLKCINHTS